MKKADDFPPDSSARYGVTFDCCKSFATGCGRSLRLDKIEGFTYQMDNPIGLDLKLPKSTPKDTLKIIRSGTILSGFSGVLLGPVLMALGPAL